MSRSSSSSASTPSRMTPPSRASAGGSSTSVASMQLRARRRGRRARRPGCATQRRLQLARAAAATRGTAASDWRSATRSRGPAVPSAARATSRSRSWTVFSVSRSFAALGGAERELLDGVEPILDALERQQRPQQPGAQQPAAHRRDRAIDLVQQRPGACRRRADSTTSRCRSVIGSIDQAVGAGAVADRRGRARGRPSACRAGTGPARRRR